MLETLGEPTAVALFGLAGGISMGLAARLGRFCTLGAIEDALYANDTRRLRMWAVAIGVAIMRYRLYEIDTIVNRSLIFGSLAAFIGGVYVAIVVGVAAVLGGDVSFQLSIVATILVALAFQPRGARPLCSNPINRGKRNVPTPSIGKSANPW